MNLIKLITINLKSPSPATPRKIVNLSVVLSLIKDSMEIKG